MFTVPTETPLSGLARALSGVHAPFRLFKKQNAPLVNTKTP